MYNDDLVSGFDSARDDNLIMSLQSFPDLRDSLLVCLTGYIDTYNSPFFQDQLAKIVKSGFYNLIFDCTKLKYVSSTGIGVFSSLLKTLKTQGGDVMFFGLKQSALEVFQLLGFSQLFKMKANLEEALAFIKQGVQSTLSIFPKEFICPVCSKRLRTSCAGRFRCSECKTILTVNAQGEVSVG